MGQSIPSTPPLVRVLLSADSHILCFPDGSCQLILVSFVHFASFAGSGAFDRIFDPLVGFAEEGMSVKPMIG